jgi:hypothetical protein
MSNDYWLQSTLYIAIFGRELQEEAEGEKILGGHIHVLGKLSPFSEILLAFICKLFR